MLPEAAAVTQRVARVVKAALPVAADRLPQAVEAVLPVEARPQPVAAVVPRIGRSVDTAALRAWCRERLAVYQAPVDVVTVPELPRDALGKVRRRELAARYGQGWA